MPYPYKKMTEADFAYIRSVTAQDRVWTGDDIAREYPRCRREIEVISDACRDCGRDVPGEVCVTGFDNSSISQVVKPALTTLAHDQKGIARAVLDTIESMVHGEVPQDRHFLTRMVARGTTR